MNVRKWIMASVVAAGTLLAHAQEQFTMGETLFSQNRPSDAIPYLRDAILSENEPKAYVYLALAYYQTGQLDQSLATCTQGMGVSGTNKKILAYNAGNTAYTMGDYALAEQWFSTAIAADPSFASPVLNRANARLSQKKYEQSIDDYTQYLALAPDDAQSGQIQELIAAIRGQMQREEEAAVERAQEAERLRQEEERIAVQREQEAARQAADREKAAAEEAERRRRLLEDVAASLQDSQSENISAGTESTVDYGYETDFD